MERFTEALNDPDGGRQAAEALRSLIGEIVLAPGPKRGEVHAELRGELMGILAFATDQKPKQNIRFMSPVASSCVIGNAHQTLHRQFLICDGGFRDIETKCRCRNSSENESAQAG
ncbi:hypothetical protein [Aureimonas populi]|uniref:Uncharacterized protein n=1 Tax=Aureimonas populi TaxID=1701758 RepID=A0ABW5CKG2_9HYPH|nr:hypothetical protein [Aureimonas populi]